MSETSTDEVYRIHKTPTLLTTDMEVVEEARENGIKVTEVNLIYE